MSASAPSATANPGVNAPLAFISKDNQGGLVAVITALALTFVLVSFLLRAYIRYSNGPWKRDDHIFTAVAILSCVQSAIVFFEVSKGLGKVHRLVSALDLAVQQKAYFANNILYIVILFLSKCSVGFLYLRLSPVRQHKLVVWGILALSSIWALMSILLTTIECPWQSGCTNLFQRWEAIGVIDILTDVALFFVSVLLVKDLQMPWQPKAIVIAAFGTRLLVIAPCILRLYYLSPDAIPTERNLATSLAVVCTQLQIGYGTVAATFPCLRPFVTVYEQPAADSTPKHASSYYHNHRRGTRGDVNLTSIASTTSHPKPKSRNRSPDPNGSGHWTDAPTFRPDQGIATHTATVSYYDKKTRHQHHHINKKNSCSNSLHSHDSRQKMIIERKVDYSVTYDERSLRDEGDGAGTGERPSADGHVLP